MTTRGWASLALWTGGALAASAAGLLGLGLAVQALTRSRIVPAHLLPELPVALVLGAEVYADNVPSPFLRARLDLAVQLYRAGSARRILVSGDGSSPFYDETAGMRDYLLAAGVPESALLLDPAGFDTYDSCLRARDVFGLRRLAVVSQTYHLPRALAICWALGIDAYGVGDETVREHSVTWDHGVRRELAANVKLAWDVISRRPSRAEASAAQRSGSA